jgi:predicted transcriptional regulator
MTKPVPDLSPVTFTPTQFAKRHGISRSTIYRLIGTRQILTTPGPTGMRRISVSQDRKMGYRK